jgi:CheY-like chemotaxis protein
VVPPAPLVPSLLRALVRADGNALVLHVGERPYVDACRGRVEVGTRGLPGDVLDRLVAQLMPMEEQRMLDEAGVVQYVLPHLPDFAGEHFTVVATSSDDSWVVIRRRRLQTDAGLQTRQERQGLPGRQGSPGRRVSDAGNGPPVWPPVVRRTKRTPPVVLMIEDSLDQIDLYECVLRHAYRMKTALRGEIGVNLALADPPDLILLDLEMPGMHGWEVCRRLKADPRTASIPIMILTARDPEGLRTEAVRVGAAALLTKPCGVNKLLDRIKLALEGCPIAVPD